MIDFDICMDGELDHPISSIEDFATWFAGTTPDHIAEKVQGYSDGSMEISWDDDSITLSEWVSDAECDGPIEILAFPFSADYARETIVAMEAETDRLWREWRDSADEDGED